MDYGIQLCFSGSLLGGRFRYLANIALFDIVTDVLFVFLNAQINIYKKCTIFWFWALMVYTPLLLIDVAKDRDENSTDPWLSLMVFNHSS